MDSIVETAQKLTLGKKDLQHSLPYDIVCYVVKLTNIGYVNLTLAALGGNLSPKEKAEMVRNRFSPFVSVRELVESPRELFAVMRHTRTILAGSRAVNYFVPGSSDPGSDWDFFCGGNSAAVEAFKLWSRELGMRWDEGDGLEPAGSGPAELEYRGRGRRIVRGTAGKLSDKAVQLIYKPGLASSQDVVEFHSTPAQCFISGFCAVSMYHKLTSRSMAVSWKLNGVPSPWKLNRVPSPQRRSLLSLAEERQAKAVLKYSNRGFSYVSYEEYAELCASGTGLEAESGGMLRHVGDSKCSMVSFEGYFDTSLWDHRISHCLSSLKLLQWKDGPGRCSSHMSMEHEVSCLRSSPELRKSLLRLVMGLRRPPVQECPHEPVARVNGRCVYCSSSVPPELVPPGPRFCVIMPELAC